MHRFWSVWWAWVWLWSDIKLRLSITSLTVLRIQLFCKHFASPSKDDNLVHEPNCKQMESTIECASLNPFSLENQVLSLHSSSPRGSREPLAFSIQPWNRERNRGWPSLTLEVFMNKLFSPLRVSKGEMFLFRISEKVKVVTECFSFIGFTGGFRCKESTCQCRRRKRRGFDPWVVKIPWRRKWQPTPVFLPGESYGQRSLAGYSS